MKISEFERLSRQKLLKEEVEFDPHYLWASMENRLDVEMPQHKRSRRRFFWILLPVFFISAALITDTLINHESSSQLFSVAQIEMNQRKDALHAHISVEEGTRVQQNIIEQNEVVSAKPRSLQLKSVPTKEQRKTDQNSVILISPPGNHQRSLSSYLTKSSPAVPNVSVAEVQGLSKADRLGRNPLPLHKLKFQSIDFIERKEIPDLSASSTGAIKFSHRSTASKLNFRFSSGVTYQISDYYTESEELLGVSNALNTHLSDLESVHGSVEIGYSMGAFAVATGLHFQRMKEVLKLERITQIERQLENALLEIRINPHTQDSTFVRGTVTQQGQSYQSIRHYNSMNIWSVPLQFEFLPPHDRWGFGLASGLLFSFSQSKKGRFLQLDGSVSDVESRHPKNIHYLTIEPIFSLKLGSPFSIQVRPRFQKALGSSTEVHSILRKQTLFGMDLSIRYQPPK